MDIILTNYFTTKKDPQRSKPRPSNDSNLVNGWINSLTKLKLNGIIFYDSLSNEFINKYSNDYVTFIYYKPKTSWSLNDERFLCWYEFIKENTQYERIITTDLFDVSFNKNPFDLVTKDYRLFVGSNGNRKIGRNNYVTKKMLRMYKFVYHKNKTSVNAGVIGGYRNNILLLFSNMIKEFRKYNLKMNMNMCVYNKCVYDLFEEKDLLIGYPFTSMFKTYEKNGNYAIRHK